MPKPRFGYKLFRGVKMIEDLPDGIPTRDMYNELSNLQTFKEMEIYSQEFLNKNKQYLEYYSKKWVKDPFHQWSRLWEYPFVYNMISKYALKFGCDRPKIINVLDAGSGATFFPYYVTSNISNANVTCIDQDLLLEPIFSNIYRDQQVNVDFHCSSIHNLPIKSQSMDIIYSISVLEHTDNYEQILREFNRVLKPNGLIIITFDVSLDKLGHLSLSESKAFIEIMRAIFNNQNKKDYFSGIDKQKMITTRYIEKINPELLPIQLSFSDKLIRLASCIVKNKQFSYMPNMTFCCTSLEKGDIL